MSEIELCDKASRVGKNYACTPFFCVTLDGREGYSSLVTSDVPHKQLNEIADCGREKLREILKASKQ